MKRRLLIIDDEEVLRNNLKLFLDTEGYNVAIAANSTEGFKLLDEFRPGFLLVDIHLQEEISGIDILKKVKAEKPDVKVLVMTGFGGEGPLEQECFDAGADKFLWKPMTPTELVKELDET